MGGGGGGEGRGRTGGGGGVHLQSVLPCKVQWSVRGHKGREHSGDIVCTLAFLLHGR